MKDRIRQILRETNGTVEGYLEEQFENKVLESVSSRNKKEAEAWLTYNQVILELKHNIKDALRAKELQYRLTGSENPNKSCLNVLVDIKRESPELERLYYKIMNF
jgi:hypothetical protein